MQLWLIAIFEHRHFTR